MACPYIIHAGPDESGQADLYAQSAELQRLHPQRGSHGQRFSDRGFFAGESPRSIKYGLTVPTG